MELKISDRIEGLLLGMAVGDALGLPREGLSRRRAERLFGKPPLRHRFFFGLGLFSDDTEHACLTAQALLESRGDPKQFASSLAKRLRWWLLALPAGVGLATAKGILKLWLGFPPQKSGVYSAGNGPAMRSPVLGAWVPNDLEQLKKLVENSTRITHTDPKAFEGAFAIAIACQYAASRTVEQIQTKEVLSKIMEHISDSELRNAFQSIHNSLIENLSADDAAQQLGLQKGVSGYIVHTAAMSIYCWLHRLGDFRSAVEEIISLGGDTDTTGAITGALAGVSVGPKGIPQDWLNGIREWPRSIPWIRNLAKRLSQSMELQNHSDSYSPPLPLFWPGILLRNLLFLIIVLLHGFRRLFPPF